MWPVRRRRRLEWSCHEHFEKSAVPQALIDRDGVLTEVNAAFGRLVGEPAEQLTGRAIGELNHRSDTGEADASLARLLTGTAEATQCERVIRRYDGRPVPTLVSATVLRDGAGRPAGAAALYQDLSVLRGAERRRQQQEDFFLALARRASDLAVVLDPDGRVLFASHALAGVLGHAVEDVVAEEATSYVHPEDAGTAGAVFAAALADGDGRTATIRVRDARGAWRWMELAVGNLLDTAVGGVVCNLRDVTDRVRAQTALSASERRYRTIADHADEGLWLTAPDGRTAYVNQRLADILGLPAEEILGRPALEVLGPAAREVTRLLAASPDPGPAERREVAYRHPDGRQRVLLVSTTPLDDVDGALEGSLAMVADVTEARRLERELREAALHDTLTRLPNRALLRDRLQHALARETRATAALLVDLDHFGPVNAAHGHAVGDELLVDVATRLSAAVRPSDTVARFAGDQFLVVCEDVDEEAARAVAASVLEAFGPPFVVTGGDVRLSASVGLALTPADSAAALLRHAETATYAAKAAGRGRVEVFDAGRAEEARHRFELGVELARSLAGDELRLHYQPVVDLQTGQVVGVEALARWHHRLLGPVPPSRFVAVAEAEGLTGGLDRWAVRRAVREAAELRSERLLPPGASVAVNLSARSLADPDLEAWVADAAAAGGLPPEDVVLEVTESATMTDAAGAADVLGRLRERGFQVAVDDFGTGHSSLSYLRQLPVSVLKIDRSFISEIATDSHARAITGSIIALARTIGLTVVAEGVESPEHAVLLRRLGADNAQGWLWSPAVSPEEAARTGALCRCYDVGDVGDAGGSSSSSA